MTAVDLLLTVLVSGVIVIAVTVVVGAGISLMIALAINRTAGALSLHRPLGTLADGLTWG